jgi:hypothetical protein
MRFFTVLMLQIVGSFGVLGIGVWAITRPKHFQGFLNENFALLPAVKPRSFVTSMLIRAAGSGLILLGCTDLLSLRHELVSFGLASRWCPTSRPKSAHCFDIAPADSSVVPLASTKSPSL